MLLALAAALLVFWVLALAFKVTVGFVHLLVVGAIILFALHFIRGRGVRTPV